MKFSWLLKVCVNEIQKLWNKADSQKFLFAKHYLPKFYLDAFSKDYSEISFCQLNWPFIRKIRRMELVGEGRHPLLLILISIWSWNFHQDATWRKILIDVAIIFVTWLMHVLQFCRRETISASISRNWKLNVINERLLSGVLVVNVSSQEHLYIPRFGMDVVFALNLWSVNSDFTEKLTICACSDMAWECHFDFKMFLTSFVY